MTRVFLYEYVTGGGMLDQEGDPRAAGSLLREGGAMLTALASDFSGIAGIETVVLRDHRLPLLALPGCQVHVVHEMGEEQEAFQSTAAAADWTVVVAPEFDGILLNRCRQVQAAGGRLLGPAPEIVAVAADKQQTADHLQAAGVAVPTGLALEAGSPLPTDFVYPAVLKPRFGAGSHEVYLITARSRARAFDTDRLLLVPRRLERFLPGTPASVAVLCGPACSSPTAPAATPLDQRGSEADRRVLCLPPCRQHLSDDGRFRYQGGSVPLEPRLARRAAALAAKAVGTLDRPLGYLGVDLVLGEDPDGADDAVIEINPRFTTSYVGLRAAAKHNLAAAVLAIAEGREVLLDFHSDPIHFYADGRVERNDE